MGERAGLNGDVRTAWVQGKGRERKGKEGRGREGKGKEGKGRERTGKEGKRKGKEVEVEVEVDEVNGATVRARFFQTPGLL